MKKSTFDKEKKTNENMTKQFFSTARERAKAVFKENFRGGV